MSILDSILDPGGLSQSIFGFEPSDLAQATTDTLGADYNAATSAAAGAYNNGLVLLNNGYDYTLDELGGFADFSRQTINQGVQSALNITGNLGNALTGGISSIGNSLSSAIDAGTATLNTANNAVAGGLALGGIVTIALLIGGAYLVYKIVSHPATHKAVAKAAAGALA